MTSKQHGILISYLIGAPLGLITVFIVLMMPGMLTGEGLGTIVLVGVYGKSILGLLVSFLIALGIGGQNASIDIRNQKSLLKTSFRYSVIVNAIIWTVFILLTVVTVGQANILLMISLPIFAFMLCTIFTTITIGLLICYLIKKPTIIPI